MSEINTTDPLGVLENSKLPLKSEYQDDTGDGWQTLLVGEETRRAKSLIRVAYTRAEITFDSEENLLKFLEIIKESDDRLKKIPDAEAMYDWQKITRKDLTVRFGVAWYDKEYFNQRKNAYQSSLHRGIFSQFGVTQEALRIEHIVL